MKAIGIDIGTTTVCGIVMDTASGEILDVKTISNNAVMQGESFERLQNPEKILCLVQSIYHEFLERFRDICCIGLTGQMHGIVFTDENGMAVSPLYTWQDESGNEKMADGRSYAEHLSEKTGYDMASGYGITTLYCLTMQDRLPEHASGLCTIPDYIGMRMTGRKAPVITASMGASLGCFDLHQLEFDKEKIKSSGMTEDFLPECKKEYVLLGKTPEGIPVAAAIGDNQASVLGSVGNPRESVLINVGTGSQVSAGIDHYVEAKQVELRPLVDEEYILVGSSLCGGRAYAALEKFFSMTVEAMTGKRPDSLYEKMSDLMKDQNRSNNQRKTLTANTRFCGTRENPSITGSFTNLTLENFTPGAMTEAVLNGIAEELVTFHQRMVEQGAKTPKVLVGSGNGIRMNPWFRQIFEEIYHLPMRLPAHQEEAAFGAARYAMCAAGEKENMNQARELIKYEQR